MCMHVLQQSISLCCAKFTLPRHAGERVVGVELECSKLHPLVATIATTFPRVYPGDPSTAADAVFTAADLQ